MGRHWHLARAATPLLMADISSGKLLGRNWGARTPLMVVSRALPISSELAFISAPPAAGAAAAGAAAAAAAETAAAGAASAAVLHCAGGTGISNAEDGVPGKRQATGIVDLGAHPSGCAGASAAAVDACVKQTCTMSLFCWWHASKKGGMRSSGGLRHDTHRSLRSDGDRGGCGGCRWLLLLLRWSRLLWLHVERGV